MKSVRWNVFVFVGRLGGCGGQGLAQRLFLTNPKWRSEVAGQQNFIPWRFFGIEPLSGARLTEGEMPDGHFQELS